MNLEGLSLDQMRAAVTVAEAGSFSAAARRLGRAQSAISYAIATLEAQLGLSLFDRSVKRPKPTPSGSGMIEAMRVILARSDELLHQARSISAGLEPAITIAADSMYPIDDLAVLLARFSREFPSVTVRLDLEAMGAVLNRVQEGSAHLGFALHGSDLPKDLIGIPLPPVHMQPVAAPGHGLSTIQDRIPAAAMVEARQVVLTDRSRSTEGRDFNVLSARTWRVGDLHAKHALIRAGLGWGTLPRHLVAEDLAQGRLKPLLVEGIAPDGEAVGAIAVRRREIVPGPALRWLLAEMEAIRG